MPADQCHRTFHPSGAGSRRARCRIYRDRRAGGFRAPDARRPGSVCLRPPVRNTLAELEELGYLQQPHTSAGRIPTDRGYRFYVDQLLAAPRSVRGGAAVEAQLRRDAGTPALAEDVLAAVSQVLSRASRLVAFALPMTAGEASSKKSIRPAEPHESAGRRRG